MSRSDWWERNVEKPWCQVQAAGCFGRASQTHHKKLRSQGGTDEPENLLRVCTSCHGFLHAHPAWAYEHGFMLHSWDAA